MSVIGRLDEQVEAVLINPLKRERAHDVEERETTAPHVPLDAEQDAEHGAKTSEEKREAGATLPVWLL